MRGNARQTSLATTAVPTRVVCFARNANESANANRGRPRPRGCTTKGFASASSATRRGAVARREAIGGGDGREWTEQNFRDVKVKAGSSAEAEPAPVGIFDKIYRVVPNASNNRSLWGVGLMQLLWTASTLMYVSVLPIYMKQELGLSNTKIGVLEGAAVASAFFSKVFSGIISDALRSRTAVIFVGAMLTLACKPMFAASASIKATYGATVCFYWIFSGKIADRLSKGIRAAPTDALLADLSPGDARSKAFSLCQSLATFGGVLGSSVTAAMLFRGVSYETIFLLAAVPSALAIFVLFTAVKQPELSSEAGESSTNGAASSSSKKSSGGFGEVLKNAASLPWQFYFSALIVSTLYIARFSESFVILRAKSLGWETAALPLLLTSNQILQGLFTYPMGMLADNLGRKQILTVGFLVLLAANAVFIFVNHPVGAVIGFLIVGLHMSMTQANTKALLTEYINPTQRGTAFAMFAVFSGFALSFGNTLAGILNDKYAGIGCFYGGAAATTAATILLLIYFSVVGNKQQKA
ncbi:MFS general substrate transporter [Chloropicon primus]|uniref:MFS general substrate transporter n=1 Tax=Chloropicon primus TaxID=1764295 RepID=A0A5B8MLM5_9CHLO|nr:MFS general substrate transporter [Chloropicon primus]UPQ99459.1 MFS general substrate transporter [Chloropicon primus]|eukprot:QDZ20250.1 MFS general substrate transporter [Chloropicon primus]